MNELGETPAVRSAAEHRGIPGRVRMDVDGEPFEVSAQVVAETECELMHRKIQLVVPGVHVFPEAILTLASFFGIPQRQIDRITTILHAQRSYTVVGELGVQRDRAAVAHVEYRFD